MNDNTKKILIIGGIALAGLVVLLLVKTLGGSRGVRPSGPTEEEQMLSKLNTLEGDDLGYSGGGGAFGDSRRSRYEDELSEERSQERLIKERENDLLRILDSTNTTMTASLDDVQKGIDDMNNIIEQTALEAQCEEREFQRKQKELERDAQREQKEYLELIKSLSGSNKNEAEKEEVAEKPKPKRRSYLDPQGDSSATATTTKRTTSGSQVLTAEDMLRMSQEEEGGTFASLGMGQNSNIGDVAGSVKPIKATFLRDETLSNGKRVVIRLQEDLRLRSGFTIPRNTHLTAFCNIGERLELNINSVNYAGRIFKCKLEAYDSDSYLGIYCQVESKTKKKFGQAAGNVMKGVGSTIAGMFGGAMASMAVNEGLGIATMSVSDSGQSQVKVKSGYQFFIMEAIENN